MLPFRARREIRIKVKIYARRKLDDHPRSPLLRRPRLLGLSAEECENKLLEWNDKYRIELSGEELGNVVRSAYLHRFPYRYSCRDALLRRYCPLKDESDCQAFVAGKSLTPPQRKSGR